MSTLVCVRIAWCQTVLRKGGVCHARALHKSNLGREERLLERVVW